MSCKIIGFYGPTGSGKTTELKRIAESNKNSRISFCFQENLLIEKSTVIKNVMLPLENLFSKTEVQKISEHWIKKLDLESKTNVCCEKLSGGEKQRVNLARAFAYKGEIFLFDEPFSSQDIKHKELIFSYIKEITADAKQIYIVSHDKNDLEILCDEIIEFPRSMQE